VATAHRDRFDGETWEIRSEPVIDVGGPGSWDEQHVLDPAAVLHDGRVFLYYSAVSPRCERAVCLAIAEDGIHFRRHPGNPVVIGGGPEVVVRDGVFHLYFWRNVPGSAGFQVHLATSRDGLAFDGDEPPIALPVGAPGAWDSFTVETPRIFREGGLFYLLYCGSDRNADYPFHAGLATSTDLRHWEKYPGNPVFERGAEGAWDEGAIWFTTVERIGGRYHLWYEGYGGGTARTEAYGSYLRGGRSQVGLATMDAPYFYVRPPGKTT
jgi:beta-1,2-mannobiose phosphorylase / 1,2-beta-oligomannan phosphorylase